MKKIIIIFFVFISFYLIFFMSCKKEDENRCGPFDNRFKIVSMNLRADKILKHDSIETIYSGDTLKDFDTIRFDKLALQLLPEKQTYMVNNKLNFSFVNCAYACSPKAPFSEDYIYLIQVTSDKDYDNKHKSGNDLSDILNVIVKDYYKQIYNAELGLEDFNELRENCKDELSLLFNSPPQKMDTFQFTVNYYQSGMGPNDFIMKSIKIIIKP